jgi:hypothetical protein
MAETRIAEASSIDMSGCVGQCDVPSVVVITTSSGKWLGDTIKFDQYRSLLEWAVRCRDDVCLVAAVGLPRRTSCQ